MSQPNLITLVGDPGAACEGDDCLVAEPADAAATDDLPSTSSVEPGDSV